jgi:hypothetical protein
MLLVQGVAVGGAAFVIPMPHAQPYSHALCVCCETVWALPCTKGLSTISTWLTSQTAQALSGSLIQSLLAGCWHGVLSACRVFRLYVHKVLAKFVLGPNCMPAYEPRFAAGQEVVDIEESVWATKFGVKGMVDVSVRLGLQEPTAVRQRQQHQVWGGSGRHRPRQLGLAG